MHRVIEYGAQRDDAGEHLLGVIRHFVDGSRQYGILGQDVQELSNFEALGYKYIARG